MKMGNSQKQNIAIQHKYNNRSPHVKTFEEWLPDRIHSLKQAGARVLRAEHDGTMFYQVTWEGQKPRVFTEDEFRVEYQDTYLASFGLNCSVPFEENAGVLV